MKKLLWLLAILVCGSLFLTGCGGSDDDDAAAEDAAAAPAAPAASDADKDDDTETVDPNAEFAAVIPAGLALSDKYTISGRGTVYAVRCNAIAKAASYVFTTSFGATETVSTPQTSFLKSGPDEPFTLSVYAVNADGFNSKTASASLN